MVRECYQTLDDKENADEVERNGPFLCNRANAWLGTGYYFWDTNVQWAHDWGTINYHPTRYIVCQAQFTLDETIFDLIGDVSHQMRFIKAYEALAQRSKGEVLANEVIIAMQRAKQFPFNGIRASDEPEGTIFVKYRRDKPEQMVVGQRVQICLINKNNLISRTFRIIYPEDYL